jgi:acyl transferase domain-containing protein
VIIKRLDDALRDGDPIRAIVRGSAVNQDGKTETITAPSEQAQADLIRLCYQRAGLDPAETTYFEAHGTGTPSNLFSLCILTLYSAWMRKKDTDVR